MDTTAPEEAVSEPNGTVPHAPTSPPDAPEGPVTLSQVTIGEIDGRILDNDLVVEIEGRSYTVGFLETQLPNWVDTLPSDGVGFGQVFVEREYGTGSGAVTAFEAYIAETFPNGQPIPVEPDGGIGDGAGPIPS